MKCILEDCNGKLEYFINSNILESYNVNENGTVDCSEPINKKTLSINGEYLICKKCDNVFKYADDKNVKLTGDNPDKYLK